MNITEQYKIVLEMLDQYFQTYKTNPVYIPLTTFIKNGVAENNTTLFERKLEQDGIIKEIHYVFGSYSKSTKFSELGRGKFSKHASWIKKVATEPTEEECKWHFKKFLDYVPNEQELEEEISKEFIYPEDQIKNSFQSFIEIKINPEKLYQLLEQYEKNGKENGYKKTILKLNKNNKTISRDSGGKNLTCSFRKVNGKNKRFEYIINLVQNEKIGGSKLSNTSPQNLSTEIDKINERLINNLDLTHSVIKNDNNSGYEIDRNFYNPIFV